MRQNSNLVTISIGLLISFCIAAPFCSADDSERLNNSKENTTSKARGYGLTSTPTATKQTDMAVENKKEAVTTKGRNLSATPTQLKQEILDSQERRRTGKLIFPTICISDKESEEMARMGKIGTIKERLLQAGFSTERYDKFVESVRGKGSAETLNSSRALAPHQVQRASEARIPYPTCIPKEYVEEVRKGYRPPALNTD
jgi:hypothetical protein